MSKPITKTGPNMIKTVGIVGAGFAGLSTAKTLKRFGYAVTLFEKAPDVGGVWSRSRRYPGLTTQNPRDTYALSDYPMPAHYPEWPSGEQVQTYLEGYARHFGITDHVLLNTEVQRASYAEDTQVWTVVAKRELAHGAGSECMSLSFDFLVVCNGIFSAPFVPSYEGAEAFLQSGGTLQHTSEFHEREAVRGKHVLVVGYGKSSCDVASALSQVSRSTTLVTRELIWKMPKRLGNRLNFKFLLLTRMGEALFEYIELSGIEKFLHGKGKRVRNAMLDSVQSLIASQLGLRALGLYPEKPLESIARSTVSLVSDGFFEQVRAGKLSVKKDVQIERLEKGRALLSNGEWVPADVVICGTGFEQRVPFFDAELTRRVTDERGNFQLYRSVLPLDVPRLAFNGYNSSFFSQLNCEISALWLLQHLNGDLKLPSSAEQRTRIARRLRWMEARTEGKHAKGTNLIPFSLHHIDELLVDMGLRLGLLQRIKQWLLPVDPGDYAYVEKSVLARRGARESADETTVNVSAPGVAEAAE